MQFGGSPKCPKCGKSVFFNERVRALGEDWHKTCFACTNCKKTLQLGAQAEHDDKLYCKSCHGKLFGPKGIGFGGVLADSGLKGDGEEVEYAQSDEGRASEAATKRRSFVPRRLSNRFGAASRPSPRGFSSGPGANECNKCGKTVGFAERLTALDAVWHKDCFRCNECNKRLNKGDFADSDGVAYCNPCYGKVFGPKGYGYGGTMGFNEPVDQAK